MEIIKKATVLLIATVLSTNIQAENIGLHLGIQLWKSKANGTFGEKNSSTKAESSDNQKTNFHIKLIHPFRLLPNARISTASFDASGLSEFSREYSNDTDTAHVDVVENVKANNRFNLSYVDYTLFYQVLNNGQFSMELGLTARDFGDDVVYSETADITTTTRDFIWDGPDHDDHDYHNIVETSKRISADHLRVDEIEPMVFIAGKLLTPVEGVGAFFEANISLASEQTVYDYLVGVDYDLLDNRMVDLNISAGYRASQMDFEDLDGLYSDIEFKGVFIGFTTRF